jgi:class 3 adenylate cyclase
VFCLAEAEAKEDIETVHREAHGLAPADVIEVDPLLVEAFLGRVQDPPAVTRGEEVITESAFRVVMFTDMEGSTEMTAGLGDDGAMEVLRRHNAIVRAALQHHGGREVKHTGDGFLISFCSTASALAAAVEIQRELQKHNASAPVPIRVRIGMCAGEPVAEDGDLFGSTVNLAARICAAAQAGQILTTPVVRELCLGKVFHFDAPESRRLKGFDQPVEVVTVSWE